MYTRSSDRNLTFWTVANQTKYIFLIFHLKGRNTYQTGKNLQTARYHFSFYMFQIHFICIYSKMATYYVG
jgi:hypothetical protein